MVGQAEEGVHALAGEVVVDAAPLVLPDDEPAAVRKSSSNLGAEVDTGSDMITGTLAEFERDLIRERTQAGLAAARARGRLGGRPKKLADPKQLALARTLYQDGKTDVTTICRTLGISRATLYRSLKERGPAK